MFGFFFFCFVFFVVEDFFLFSSKVPIKCSSGNVWLHFQDKLSNYHRWFEGQWVCVFPRKKKDCYMLLQIKNVNGKWVFWKRSLNFLSFFSAFLKSCSHKLYCESSIFLFLSEIWPEAWWIWMFADSPSRRMSSVILYLPYRGKQSFLKRWPSWNTKINSKLTWKNRLKTLFFF